MTNNSPRSKESFLLEAELQLKGSDVYLEFILLDKEGLFEVPKTAASWSEDQVPRHDGLWNATCFEAFLNPVGTTKYYEFNFALNPSWNAYQFENYRTPQPATLTADFVLQGMSWDPLKNRLLVELQNKTPYKQFQVGLTAVLLEKAGVKHYWALAHQGSKPDFHLRESFILQRGTE
jgi:hypothetical protein